MKKIISSPAFYHKSDTGYLITDPDGCILDIVESNMPTVSTTDVISFLKDIHILKNDADTKVFTMSDKILFGKNTLPIAIKTV